MTGIVAKKSLCHPGVRVPSCWHPHLSVLSSFFSPSLCFWHAALEGHAGVMLHMFFDNAEVEHKSTWSSGTVPFETTI